MNAIDESKLMAQVAKGDLDAFGEIVKRYQDIAWRIAYRFLGDSVEAKDIVQDAFLRILNSASRYKPYAAFSTYLYRIIIRLCIDSNRKKHVTFNKDFVEAVEPSSPSTDIIQKERDLLIRKALDALPSRQRMAVILKYYERLNYSEIAQAMDTTVKAVERVLSRARKTLKASLSDIKK